MANSVSGVLDLVLTQSALDVSGLDLGAINGEFWSRSKWADYGAPGDHQGH